MNSAFPSTIPAHLLHRVACSPSAIAFRRRTANGWSGESWATVLSRVRNLSAWLSKLGLVPGDRVAIMMPTCVEWELCHLAVLAAGCTVVGIDSHDAPANIAHVLRSATPRAAFVATQGQWESLAAQPSPRPSLGIINGPAIGSDYRSLSDLLTTPFDPPTNWPLARPSDIATIIFTSGSTGQPKGIAYSHAQLCLACEAILERFPHVSEGSRLACWLPLSNLFQRIMDLCGMMRGAESYFVETPSEIVERLQEIRPTLFVGVPRFFEKLHAGIEESLARRPAWIRYGVRWARSIGMQYREAQRHGRRPGLGLAAAHAFADFVFLRRIRELTGPDLQFMISGSAPLPPWLMESFHAMGLLVLEAYGTSEDVVPIAINTPQAFRFGSVGRPLPQNRIQLADDNELLVKGAGVCSGYLDETGPTSPIDSDGFLHTGDYATLDADGYLWLTGRKSEIFKTSTGRRVAPVPIEARIRKLPYIDHCVVLGRDRVVPIVLANVNRNLLSCDGSADSPLPTSSLQRIAHDTRVVCADLSPNDHPAAILLIASSFSIAGGELTANLKLRRANIEKKYSDQIDRLYAELRVRGTGTRILVKEAI